MDIAGARDGATARHRTWAEQATCREIHIIYTICMYIYIYVLNNIYIYKYYIYNIVYIYKYIYIEHYIIYTYENNDFTQTIFYMYYTLFGVVS
jgi:hypothetical protein